VRDVDTLVFLNTIVKEITEEDGKVCIKDVGRGCKRIGVDRVYFLGFGCSSILFVRLVVGNR